MESMLEQAEVQAVDLVRAWNEGNVNQRQELARCFSLKGSFSVTKMDSLSRLAQ